MLLTVVYRLDRGIAYDEKRIFVILPRKGAVYCYNLRFNIHDALILLVLPSAHDCRLRAARLITIHTRGSGALRCRLRHARW